MTPKKWRKSNLFSQAAVAKMLSDALKVHVSQAMVHNYENGTMPPVDVGLAFEKVSGGMVKASGFKRKPKPPIL